MKKDQIIPFIVLASVPFVMVLGNSMLIPVFPQLERALHISQVQVGLIVTAFSVPAGILIPLAGGLSDNYGRRIVMAPSLVLYGLGGLIAGLAALLTAKAFAWIIVGRVIQGIGAGGTYQLAMALTGDLYPAREQTKLLGLLEASNGLGKVISPIAGSLIAMIVWFAPFFAYGLLALPVAALIWFVVKEPVERSTRSIGEYVHAVVSVFKQKGIPLLALYFAGMVGLFLLFGLLSFVSEELEARFRIFRFAKGFVLAIPVATMALASLTTGWWLQGKRDWLKPVLLTGLSLVVAGFALFPFFRTLVPFILFSSVIGLGLGLSLPPINTMITMATDRDERGMVTALYGTVRFFGVAAGPPLFGMVQNVGPRVMFWGGGAIALLALLVAVFFAKTDVLFTKAVGADADETAPSEKTGGAAQTAEPDPAPWSGLAVLGEMMTPPLPAWATTPVAVKPEESKRLLRERTLAYWRLNPSTDLL